MALAQILKSKNSSSQQQEKPSKDQQEIQRLTQELKKANEQAEHFERLWYLQGEEIEKLKEKHLNLDGHCDGSHVQESHKEA